MKKLFALLGIFALLIFAGSANAQISNLTINPLIDGMCHNGESYNNSAIDCLHAVGSPNENYSWTGDDVFAFNIDVRTIWSFNISSIPIGSSIENATFCTYILQSFGDQVGSANYAPIGIGDLNFYPINMTENYINDTTLYLWNSTPIFSTVVDSDNFSVLNTTKWENACIQGDCSGSSISVSGNNLVVTPVSSSVSAGRSTFNLSGDFSFKVMINNTNWSSYEQAVIQIFRAGDSNTPNNANRITLIKPYPSGDYVSFYYYDAIDNIEQDPSVNPQKVFEYNDSQKWIRVDRVGRFLNLYKSTDGTNWEHFYTDESLSTNGIQLNDVNIALGAWDTVIQYYGDYQASNYTRLRMGFDYPVSYSYHCWDFADWAEQMLPTGRFTIRAESQLADGDGWADFVNMYNMDSGTNPPYLYLEYEAPNATEELIIDWISPTPNNSIINTTNHIIFKVNLSETPLVCNLSINNTANVSMTINMAECTYTTGNLENGTYCGVVTANDIDESNTSTEQCAIIEFSTPPPSPIDNLGLFSGVALLLMGAGVLLFLLEGLFEAEILKNPKNIALIIIGALIMVAILGSLL